MPKATVDEYCDTGREKCEVWLTDEVSSATPTSDALLPKNSRKSKFGGLIVPTLDPRHDFRPLRSREDVGQELPLSRVSLLVGNGLGHAAHSQEVTA